MSQARRERSAGFSLVEMLVALALTGLVLSMLAMVVGQLMPNWHRGFGRVQQAELVALALERLAADVAAVEFVPAGLDSRRPLFDGTASSITFVRTALGPNAQPGLEIVTLGATGGRDGPALARRAAPYAPRRAGDPPPGFGPAAVLLRPPYRVWFSYAGRDGRWVDAWQDFDELPRGIRVVVRDDRSGRTLDASTVVELRTELPADCVGANPRSDCGPRRSPDGAAAPGDSP